MNKLHYWLLASSLFNNIPSKALAWYQHFGTIEKMFAATQEQLTALSMPAKYSAPLKNPNWQLIQDDVQWLQHPHHHCIAYEDEHYPESLKQIADPPLLLYLQGDKTALTQTQIAIVGARNATPQGKNNAA